MEAAIGHLMTLGEASILITLIANLIVLLHKTINESGNTKIVQGILNNLTVTVKVQKAKQEATEDNVLTLKRRVDAHDQDFTYVRKSIQELTP